MVGVAIKFLQIMKGLIATLVEYFVLLKYVRPDQTSLSWKPFKFIFEPCYD